MKVKGDRKCKIYIVISSVSVSLSRHEIQLSQNGESEDVYVSNETNNVFVSWPGSTRRKKTIKTNLIEKNA